MIPPRRARLARPSTTRVFLAALCISFALGACAPVDSVGFKRLEVVEGLWVTPAGLWNDIKITRHDTWTADGLPLNDIRFFSGIGDGDPFFENDSLEDEELPLFRRGMTASEITDGIMDSLSLSGNANLRLVELAPYPFGGRDGFRATIAFTNQAGVNFRAAVYGVVVTRGLTMVIYRGAEIRYFDRHLRDVDTMMTGAQLT